jgi:hypothetical protein
MGSLPHLAFHLEVMTVGSMLESPRRRITSSADCLYHHYARDRLAAGAAEV